MAESLLLPVVRGVAGKAADALVQRVTRMWGVDDDRCKLERRLAYVQSLLADAAVKSKTNHAVRTWMKELKAVAYWADDVLDDFQYEALRREAQSRWSKTSKVLGYFTSQNRLVFRYKASRELKNVLDKIDELVLEMNTFGLVERAEVPQGLYRQTHSALDESAEIFGRDNDKEVVVNLLLDQQDQKNVQVLPIVGMGGLGKTTLAKMVYNDSMVQNHFELKMWCCVSENFEAIAVVRSVIELATNERCDLPDNIELLRGKLQEVIGRKRFLLVLDDVWNEDQHKWEDELKPLLCCIGGSGSMIVVTSRSPQVAAIMGTLTPHKLLHLSEEDSWELFSRKAFSNGQEQTELVTIGRRIVSNCKGLPLALKTLGGLMSSKQQVQEWEDVAESNIGDTSRGKNEVLSILELSYRHLSPEMKQCFAFCAIFPKDYEMEKDKLIQLWMANCFIHADRTMNLQQKGDFVFKELAWRSFFQDVKEMSFYTGTSYKAVGCKMHDLMHDLAKDVTDECAFAEELIQEKALVKYVHHMQMSRRDLEKIRGLLRGKLSFRTLLSAFQYSEHMHLKKLRLGSLRATCCTDPSIMHRRLLNASHLRYLDLSGSSSMVRLPDMLCLFYNLQTLRLNGCTRLQYLPDGITTMRKLSHLYLLGCDGLEQMPPNLGLLHNLCTLTTFVVDTRDGCGIEELKDLSQLSNRLELFNLTKVKNGSKVNLHEKQNLHELVLCWGRKVNDDATDDDASEVEEVLESLKPHSKLKTLKVHGYGGLRMSQWMGNPQMLHHLRELKISHCPGCKDLPIVWLSPSLEYLSLSQLDSLTTLCKIIEIEAEGYGATLQILPKLKQMTLEDLPLLERWAENCAGEPISTVMIPLLEELSIYTCFKLATLPESPVLKRLICVNYAAEVVSMSMPLGSWPSLARLYIAAPAKVVMPLEGQQSQRPLNTMRTLEVETDAGFESIFNLSTLQRGLFDCLAFVEELEISSCDNITRWPAERSVGMGLSFEVLPLPLLKSLTICFCPRLLEIPELPVSLEMMEILDCGSLMALPSNLGDLAKLRDLDVRACQGLKALPDGMDGLTSLERLTIALFPGIKEFPQGLLQRLPALKYLEIWGCPLQRACREGGEYFDLVSSIPNKRIPAVRESKTEKSVKRFLPFCGGDPKLSLSWTLRFQSEFDVKKCSNCPLHGSSSFCMNLISGSQGCTFSHNRCECRLSHFHSGLQKLDLYLLIE
ncbi:hypothetical protein ACP70R_016035 [Stipagrostis hirtigluma subsp. patula]